MDSGELREAIRDARNGAERDRRMKAWLRGLPLDDVMYVLGASAQVAAEQLGGEWTEARVLTQAALLVGSEEVQHG